jgi:leader peptidase (prepilin peptidase) / N-methyltransferase
VSAAAVLLGVVACGLGGCAVPALIARLPEPEADPEHSKTPYAQVAASPGLGAVAVLVSAVGGGVVGASVGLAWPLLFLLPLVPVGVALGVVDWRTHLLPTVVVRPTFAAVVVLAAVSALLEDDLAALVRAGIGAAVVFGIFHLLWWIHPAGMGYGDVRLSALLGFALGYLGWPELLVGIYGGFLAFAVARFVVALVRRDRQVLRTSYPFGPFLLVGALAGLAVGPEIWGHLVSG